MAIAVKSPLKARVQLGPLGLLPSFMSKKRASEAVLKKLSFLQAFDMERECKIIAAELELDDYLSHLFVREFKRFFALELLVPEPDHSFVPSHEIDPVWHHLVLDSRRYVELCDALYGGYVHHTPADTCPAEFADNAGEKFGYTKSLLKEAFGGVPPAAWGAAAHCNRAACDWP